MRINPFSVIWRADPVRIAMPADAEAALTRIRARLPGWRWFDIPLFTECCIGRVEGTRVRVEHRLRWRRNGFSPVLDAIQVADAAGPCLKGVYRGSWMARIWLSTWFGFLTAFLVVFYPTLLLSDDRRGGPNSLVGMFIPVGMFIFGLLILWIGQRTWPADKAYIERFLAECCEEAERR